MMPASRRFLPLLLALVGASAAAQARAVDEGTFILARAGSPVGTESFQIIRLPGEASPMFRLTAQRTLGDQRIATTLLADSMGTPRDYMLTIRTGSDTALALRAKWSPGRLGSIAKDRNGNESMKEYVVTPGTSVIVDEDLCHQLYLLALNRRGGPLKVIVPRTGRELSVSLSPSGLESIEAGGRTVTATRYT